MTDRPIISVITVVLNDRQHIESTIKSVLHQTYPHIEYIIIDGGSTDGTCEIIENYAGKISAFVSGSDDGIYDAMNKGLTIATGNYVLFLNSGDMLYENDTVKRIFSLGEADIYFGDTAFYDQQGKFIGLRSKISTRALPEKLTYRNFLMGMPVSHQAFIVKKELAPEFDNSYNCSADADWCIKCLKSGRIVTNTRLVISRYLVGGHSHRHPVKCWVERFKISIIHFGLILTLFSQIRIFIRYLYKRIFLKRKF